MIHGINNEWENKEKDTNSARLLNDYKSTLIRNAQDGPLLLYLMIFPFVFAIFFFALDFPGEQ